MKKVLCFMIFALIGEYSYAFNIVYPKKHMTTISSATTFFIGSSKRDITINGVNIKRHKTGAFAYFVNLKYGENTFTIRSKNDTEIYTITHPKIEKDNIANSKYIPYNQKKYFIVKNDSPLRTTPLDFGINRINNLEKEILLTIVGEQNDFYQVDLGNGKQGWINKKDVILTNRYNNANVNLYNTEEYDGYITYMFNLDAKVPFKITEGENIILNFYNTNDNYSFTFPYKERFHTAKIFGYSGEYDENLFIFKIKKPPKIDKQHPLKDIKIVVDAGHGGKELGAIGCLGDKEKDINLKMAKLLAKELKSHGANVIMTRDDDSDLELNERIKITNDNNAMIFISIHNNALPDNLNPNIHRGTSVYYFDEHSKLLANYILNSMLKISGVQNDNLHRQSFAVLRNPKTVSVLIEVGYMINPEDNEMLVNTKFQKKCVKAIATGIKQYLLSE